MSGCRRAARPLLLDCQCLAIVSACKRQNQDTFLGHRIRFYLDQYAFKSLPSDGKPFALDAQGCGHGTKPIKNSHFNFQRRIIGIDALAIHVNSPVHPPKITFGRHGLLGCSGATPVLLYGTGLLIMFDGYTSAYSTDKLSPVPFLLGLREQEMFTNN